MHGHNHQPVMGSCRIDGWRVGLFVAPHNTPAARIVCREFQVDAVAGKNTDEAAAAHLAGRAGQHLETAIDLHAKHRVRESLNDAALYAQYVLFGQDLLLNRDYVRGIPPCAVTRVPHAQQIA